jgi:N-acyl-phosphatidylethanolamine-hydrolysing phospholipase D
MIMNKKKFPFLILTLIVFAISLQGCWYAKLALRNMTDVLFKEPEKLKNKIKDPIRDNVRFSVLWIGHSSVLLQLEEKVILIDPLFENAIGGTLLRKVEPGIDLNSIPRLDMILISHAHMDHMSLASLNWIDKKFPDTKLVFPAGAENYLPSYSMDMIRIQTGNSKERDYVGQSMIINGVKITAVFAEHFGGRYGWDSYQWNVPGCTGYIIEYDGITIFYAGDTAYDEEAYVALGNKFDIDLALIPIGPCRDCKTDGNFRHVASLGALKLFDDLKAEYMIPVHYGIVEYTGDPNHPVHVLKFLIYSAGSSGIAEDRAAPDKQYTESVIILEIGEQYIFEYKSNDTISPESIGEDEKD